VRLLARRVRHHPSSRGPIGASHTRPRPCTRTWTCSRPLRTCRAAAPYPCTAASWFSAFPPPRHWAAPVARWKTARAVDAMGGMAVPTLVAPLVAQGCGASRLRLVWNRRLFTRFCDGDLPWLAREDERDGPLSETWRRRDTATQWHTWRNGATGNDTQRDDRTERAKQNRGGEKAHYPFNQQSLIWLCTAAFSVHEAPTHWQPGLAAQFFGHVMDEQSHHSLHPPDVLLRKLAQPLPIHLAAFWIPLFFQLGASTPVLARAKKTHHVGSGSMAPGSFSA